MPKQDPIARRLLVAQVRDLATGVGLAVRTARALNLPVEPGVSEARDKLILWAHPLDDVVPSWPNLMRAAPSPGRGRSDSIKSSSMLVRRQACG
jgi:hypothetical protein